MKLVNFIGTVVPVLSHIFLREMQIKVALTLLQDIDSKPKEC